MEVWKGEWDGAEEAGVVAVPGLVEAPSATCLHGRGRGGSSDMDGRWATAGASDTGAGESHTTHGYAGGSPGYLAGGPAMASTDMEAIGVSEGILCRGTYTRLSADDVTTSMYGVSFALLYGTGPIVDKMLKEKGLDIVVVGELGPGAKTLLEMGGIRMIQAVSGIKVKDSLA